MGEHMIYSKTEFSKEIFKNPPPQYCAMPFWAWNRKLEKEEMLWQINKLKEMGFGGF